MTRDIVLLHGWGMSANVWQGIGEKLAQDFRVHAVDLPGHGDRTHEKLSTLTEFVHCLAESLPKKVAVVGWSLGGTVALSWAAARPHQIYALVLVATTPSFAARIDWRHGWPGDALDSFERELIDDHEKTLSRFLVLQSRGDSAERDVLRMLRQSVRCAPPSLNALSRGFEILRETDLRGDVASLWQPTLVVHGESDSVAPVGAAQWLAQQLPNSRLRIFKDCAHAPFISQPGQFMRESAAFLEVASH